MMYQKFVALTVAGILTTGIISFTVVHFVRLTPRTHLQKHKIAGIIPYNPVQIARVTGNSLPGETLPNPNETAKKYDLGGTDLGIMWAMGNGKTGLFFGDTFGKDWTVDDNGNDWRSNVLAFSVNRDLDEGIKFTGIVMNTDGLKSREIIHSRHDKSGKGDYTAIPTGAIRIGTTDYVTYMNVKNWGKPGEWATNYSGLYKSNNDGQTWEKCAAQFSAKSNFAQTALAKKDGYVYMMGIGAGRFGKAYVARFLEKDIADHHLYQYWTIDKTWVTNQENKTVSVFGPIVGEPSLAYNSKYHLWMATYISMKTSAIMFRYAKQVQGPWSSEETLLNKKGIPGLYGGFIYPYKNDGDELYFTISVWPKYNVFWMKAKLKPIYE